jgi:cGMP-dependent protein kinase 2
VAALNDGSVWVLERPVFRTYIQEGAESRINELEVFLNSVPLLNSLNKEERITLADAMEERRYEKDQRVITQGEPGDFFYIIRDGEAAVIQAGDAGQQKKLNHLFRSDYFGEMALLREEPRMATVVALTTLKVARIDKATFRQILGPLEELMKRDKSNQVRF